MYVQVLLKESSSILSANNNEVQQGVLIVSRNYVRFEEGEVESPSKVSLLCVLHLREIVWL